MLRSDVSILVVEDEELNAFYYKTFLTRKGFSVKMASCGSQAKALYESGPTDLIIMDGLLPDGTGAEITQYIRTYEQDRGLRPCRILGISGFSADEVAGKFIEAGMDDYLVKPVASSVLLDTIDRHLAA